MFNTIATLGRRLRLGVVGGGAKSFIGPVHRSAARMDDNYEVVASVLSSDPERSRKEGAAIGIAPDRAYGSVEEMFAGEQGREDGIEVVLGSPGPPPRVVTGRGSGGPGRSKKIGDKTTS